MPTCKLIILDQVNIRFADLDAMTRKKIVEKLKFLVPYARHMPQFKLGRWDGKVGFATVGGQSYFNVLDRILPIVEDAGYDIEVDDRRPDFVPSFPVIDEAFLSDRKWPSGHPAEGEPIMLRDYQVEAINRYTGNPHSIQCLSTGSGKTITTAALSLLCEPHGRTIVIVPSKSLVEQTEEDYRNIGLDVGVFYGNRKEYGHTHTIATWQSLGAFCRKKDDFDSIDRSAFADFIEGVVCVMVDECHTSKATVLKDVLTGPMGHIPLRWGMTGTVPRDEWEAIPLLISIGPVIGEVKAKTLQDKGVLAGCKIEMIALDDSAFSYSTYPSEYDYLTTDQTRLQWMADKIMSLDGNTVVLVDRLASAEILHSLIPDSVVVSGNTKMSERTKEFKDFNEKSNKVMIATYGVAAVGLNIPKINNLFAVEFGKSFIRCIQSIGRILRKAKGKTEAMVYDVHSTAKFSAKHAKERKKYYDQAEYPYSVTRIHYR